MCWNLDSERQDTQEKRPEKEIELAIVRKPTANETILSSVS